MLVHGRETAAERRPLRIVGETAENPVEQPRPTVALRHEEADEGRRHHGEPHGDPADQRIGAADGREQRHADEREEELRHRLGEEVHQHAGRRQAPRDAEEGEEPGAHDFSAHLGDRQQHIDRLPDPAQQQAGAQQRPALPIEQQPPADGRRRGFPDPHQRDRHDAPADRLQGREDRSQP